MATNVLSELFGGSPEDWIIICKGPLRNKWIACSSYATKAEADERCKTANQVQGRRMRYRVVHRNNLDKINQGIPDGNNA